MIVHVQTKEPQLRPFSEADRPMLGKLLTDDRIKKTYMLPDLPSEEAVDHLIDRFVNLSRQEAHYVAGVFQGDTLVGFLNDVENDGRRIELGYVIDPAYQGRGYATQALTGVIRDLFGRGYQEVVAGAFEENKASIRVMVKSGMTKIPLEEDIDYRGKIHHCVYYSIKKP